MDGRLPPEMVARLVQMSLDNEAENVARQYGINRRARRIKDAVARRKPRKSR